MVTRAATLARPASARRTLRHDEIFWAYVFLLPWIFGLVVFILGPILFSLGLSFFNYTLGREATFVGLDNWIKAFTQDELFWNPGDSLPRDHLLMAASIIMTLPVIVLFFVGQRSFVRGVVMSGIKG